MKVKDRRRAAEDFLNQLLLQGTIRVIFASREDRIADLEFLDCFRAVGRQQFRASSGAVVGELVVGVVGVRSRRGGAALGVGLGGKVIGRNGVVEAEFIR